MPASAVADPPRHEPDAMNLLLCVVFFVSGVAALLFETLWFYQAALVFGNSVWASSLVLAGFMGGLAIGNGLIVRVGPRVRRPVRLYALLEVIIGLTGVAIVVGLPLSTPLLTPLLRPFLDAPRLLNLLRFSTAFPLLLIPSTAMGMTLPLLAAALVRQRLSFGRVLGLLYGCNTLGAVAGALLGELVLTARFGIRGTAVAAALLNGSAALVALLLAPRFDATAVTLPRQETSARLTSRTVNVLVAAGIAGAILLALEVVWFRLLLLFVHASSRTFAIMLSVVLAGIGLGGLLGGRWLARRPDAHRHLPVLAMISGSLCIATYSLFDVAARRPFQGLSIYRLADLARLMLPLMLPVSLLSGLLFTWLGAALKHETHDDLRAAGLLTLWNTVGAMLGSLAAGFILLPSLGVEQSIQLLAGCYGIVAACLAFGAFRQFGRRDWAIFCAAAGVFLVSFARFPSGLMRERFIPYRMAVVRKFYGSFPMAMREGLTETLIYLRRDMFGEPVDYELFTNSFVMSDTTLVSRRYTRLFVNLPVALHPAPRHALLIAYGLGTTAKALTETAELETIDVADPSPDILAMNHVVYPDPHDNPLNDPRVRVHVEDGRYFLQATDRRFDLITGEPPPPKNAGIVNLYTREYFQLAHARLADGGMMTYWLPAHALSEGEAKSIMRAFCEVFTDCSLWDGGGSQWMLLGSRGATGPVSQERLAKQWQDPVVGPQLRAIGVEVPEQLGALFIADAADLAHLTRKDKALVDDYPKQLSPGPSRPTTPPWYEAWMDARVTKDRFAHSPMIARRWPEALRTSTLPFFDVQGDINRYFLHQLSGPAATLEKAHDLLTHSTLRALPMWMLGSDATIQHAVAHAVAEGKQHPYINYQLSVSAMAQRQYQLAAELLSSEPAPDLSNRNSLYYRLYVLEAADRFREADAIAKSVNFPDEYNEDDIRVARFLAALRTSEQGE